jgi:hypothetical protein
MPPDDKTSLNTTHDKNNSDSISNMTSDKIAINLSTSNFIGQGDKADEIRNLVD